MAISTLGKNTVIILYKVILNVNSMYSHFVPKHPHLPELCYVFPQIKQINSDLSEGKQKIVVSKIISRLFFLSVAL